MGAKKKYNFVYKTTNLINGKFYIGVHSTNNLEDSYIGCGIISQRSANTRCKKGYRLSKMVWAVKKYGYHNFKREILSQFDTIEEAFKEEERIVDRNFIKRKDVYNTALGGRRVVTLTSSKKTSDRMLKQNPMKNPDIANKVRVHKTGTKLTQETKDKISVTNKTIFSTVEQREKRRIRALQNPSMLDKTVYTFEHRTGELFTGIGRDFISKYNLKRSGGNFSQFKKGYIKSFYGWKISCSG